MTRKYQLTLLQTVIGITLLVTISAQTFAASQQQLSSRKLRSMARIMMTYGNYEQARGYAESAYSKARSTQSDVGETALCLIDLGTVYSNLNMLSEAAEYLQSGVELQKQALFGSHPYVAHTYRLLSDVQRRSGDLQQAEESLSTAIEIMLTHCSLQSNEMAPFILESANLYDAKGQFELAQENYQKALDMAEQSYGKQHLMTSNILKSMSDCSFHQQDYQQADAYITSAIEIQGKLFGRYSPMVVDAWLAKAKICRVLGRTDRSEYYLSKAVASVEKNRDVVTVARVYEQVNQIRSEKLYAAAGDLD